MPSTLRRLSFVVLCVFAAGGSLFACSGDDGTEPEPADDTTPTSRSPKDAGSRDDGSTKPDDPGKHDAAPSADGGDTTDDDAGEADAAPNPGPPPPAGRCRDGADCTDPAAVCSVDVDDCPAPQTSTCATDDDCTVSGMICDAPRRGCGIACIQGCTGGDCGSAATCVDHRCQPNACEIDADCGDPNFTCYQGFSGKRCMRKTCTQDVACDGHCVHDLGHPFGECWGDWGTCAVPSSH